MEQKYQADYDVYETLLTNGVNVNQNLRNHHISLKAKYGDNIANALWDKFIEEYVDSGTITKE